MKKPNGNIRPKSLAVIDHNGSRKSSNASDTGMSLSEALSDKKIKVGFRKFLESEFSVENLDFWLAVEEYKKIKDIELRKTKTQEIYEEYVSPGAAFQINLDFYTRQQVMKQMSSDSTHSENTFNAAQKYVFNIMENDSYARFVRSKYYDICSSPVRRSPRKFLRDILHTKSRNRSQSPPRQEKRLSGQSLGVNNNNGNQMLHNSEGNIPKLGNHSGCYFGQDLNDVCEKQPNTWCNSKRVKSDPNLAESVSSSRTLKSLFSRLRAK